MTLEKWGGLAALTCGATYVAGFALLTTVLASAGYGQADADPAAIVAFITENLGLMTAWNLTIYVLNALALALLAVALSERLRTSAPGAARASMAFGLIWATLVLGAGMVANVGNAQVVEMYAHDPERAVELWQVASMIENGLGGGNEIAGGVWALSLAVAGFAGAGLPKWLTRFSALIALGGLSTVLPGMSETGGAVFGLGFIVWFFWAGVVLLRSSGSRPARDLQAELV